MIKSGFNIAVCTAGVALTAYTIILFSHFLSHIPQKTSPLDNDEGRWRLLAITRALIVNVWLLILFMLQHSLFAHPVLKQYMHSFGLQVVERSIYLITTSTALLHLIKYWQPVPWVTLWHINISSENQLLWWFFTLLHGYMWVAIYGGCLMHDISELLGIKQVYYNLIGLELPLNYKSPEMCRLYQHKRHPSFIGFCILFWVHPYMTFDRFLLAIIWTLYMVLAWNVDRDDLSYQERQITKKKAELKN